MQTIGSIFKGKVNESPFWKSVSASLIVEEANRLLVEFFGSEATDYARAAYLKNKVLTITCLSSVMAQEIKLNEAVLLEALARKFARQVEKIRYLA
jgi:hypothetical protein